MDDRGLDHRLRDVPPPAGLGRRVATGAFDDASLDRALRDVAIPTGLAYRIATVPLSRPAVRAAPTPRPKRRRASRAFASVVRDLTAVAAALAGIWIVAAGSAHLSRTLSPTARPAVASRPERAQKPRVVARTVPTNGLGDPQRAVAADRGGPSPPETRSAAPTAPGPEAVAVAPATTEAADAAPQVLGAAVGLKPQGVSWPRSVPRTPRDAWRRVPRSAGYDLLFELTHGEQPFIDPRNAGLHADVPPLAVQTDSFDRFIAAGPRFERLRTEHVLAAVPPPRVEQASRSEPVTLTMLAVRSLRDSVGPPTLIVEVAATVGGFSDRADKPDDVTATIVLDRAAGSEPLAWGWACRAVAAVAAQMRPADRVTLVVAGPVPRVAIREAAGDELARVAADLTGLAPCGSSDLDAALAVAQTASTRDTPIVVIAQEGVGETSGGETRAALGRRQERTAGGTDASPTEAVPDFVLVDAGTEFEPSRPAVSFGRTAADAVAIRRALLASVFGRDTRVVGRGRLTVEFDPGSVAAYRLIGHRQSAVESLAESPSEMVDLHVGETARAIYEVVPRSAVPVKAAARFQWVSADGPHEARTAIHAAGDAMATTPSPHGCELLLAVALGEEASGSPHALPRGRDAAAKLIERWRTRGDITPFGEVLADAFVLASRRGTMGRDP